MSVCFCLEGEGKLLTSSGERKKKWNFGFWNLEHWSIKEDNDTIICALFI